MKNDGAGVVLPKDTVHRVYKRKQDEKHLSCITIISLQQNVTLYF